MSFLERKTTRITGNKPQNDRRNSTIGGESSGQVPNAKKPRSRPAKSLRDRLPFPQGTLPPSSGPYSIANMEIEVPVENPRTISDIKRDGRHLLQLETVLFTMYYPAAFGSGEGQDPAGHKHWSRETWLPRPRMQTARGYAHFAGIPDWTLISFLGATSMLTKLRGFRNSPPATHWPPAGNYKQNGYKIKNQEGPPPEGHDGPRTFVNHRKQDTRSKDHRGGAKANKVDCEGDKDCEAERERWKDVDHTEEELRKGHHNIDYIFPKGNRKDTAPNNEQGVDQELRNAQIELRLCELEEAYNVLKKICSGDGEEVARQNLRSEGFVGGSSRGLKGVNWQQWKHRFHIDKMTIAGHSFGAATVVEVLRHTDRFKNVQAGIIYDIWGAPIKPPAEAPEHRIHLPLLGINSEAFMYWQQNFDAVMSLMKETKESGAPAYLLTVRGSVHISQSDFSLLYRGITELLMKATVHPQRAIDLNISASLEFLRLVAPDAGAGKSLINRAMTDEGLLETELLEEVPDEHRPTDQWIAARLKVPHEFRTRLTTGVQRHFKQKNKTGEAKYNTGDEIWMHFKPTATELQKWITEEDRGEERIDSNHAMKEAAEDGGPKAHELPGDKDGSEGNGTDGSNDAAASAERSSYDGSFTEADKSPSQNGDLTKVEANSTLKEGREEQGRDFAAGVEPR
ncbi:hypothetical protein N0V91_009522 [Didymella pomorum]|uniref:1-alkyl-2-acetylglycerophosphocholine esterase n=1 Tax=Didymella pomorum TaxID=749634 RepID=A0A9W8Z707_9PLEO|nr:hypothetical protein N0V91_009522 [Didymella pomorum]